MKIEQKQSSVRLTVFPQKYIYRNLDFNSMASDLREVGVILLISGIIMILMSTLGIVESSVTTGYGLQIAYLQIAKNTYVSYFGLWFVTLAIDLTFLVVGASVLVSSLIKKKNA